MFSLLLFVAIAGVLALPPKVLKAPRAFEGEQVVKCTVETQEKLTVIRELEDNFNLDVWKEYPTRLMDIRVNGAQLEMIQAAGIACTVYIDDLATLIQDASERRKHYTGDRNVYFTEYHTYPEQVAYYRDLCNSYSNICSIASVGTSFLGNTQYEYFVGDSANYTKPTFFLDAGIHAREWISSATLQFVFTNLLNTAGQPNSLVSRYNWIIHGHQNPDGYIFSWSADNNRLWRKSRNTNQGSTCIGTDLNRNWPTQTWGGGGSSPSPCSDTYHGSSAGSEPETRNLINRFTPAANSRIIPMAVTFHSYSQLILRPWGHTTADAPDEDAMFAVGRDMQLAIQQTHGLVYDNIKSIELYVTTGTTSDWYYQSSRATPYGTQTFGFTYELRDQGRYGFELPEDQIIPQGEEIWNAILAMADFFSN